MNPTLIILAAGMGSRYGGLKQLERLGPSGETIIDYSVYDAIRAGFGRVVFVIRDHFKDDFREQVSARFSDRIDIAYAFQEIDSLPEGFALPPERTKPWGTGHATLMAKDQVHSPFAVINADDYYGPASFTAAAGFLRQVSYSAPSSWCMIGYRLRNTLSEYGSVSRGLCQVGPEGFLESLVEHTDIQLTKDEPSVSRDACGVFHALTGEETASMNFFGFTPDFFDHLEEQFRIFLQANGEDAKAEFYLPKAVDTAIVQGKARVQVLPTADQWIGITYSGDMAFFTQRIRELIGEGRYPEKLWA